MADETSLWQEVHRLIALRKATPALCASGSIQFVYCEPEQYPLVYLREKDGTRILVALNPAALTVSCPCPCTAKETLYCHGGEVTLRDGVLTMPGETAVYLVVE